MASKSKHVHVAVRQANMDALRKTEKSLGTAVELYIERRLAYEDARMADRFNSNPTTKLQTAEALRLTHPEYLAALDELKDAHRAWKALFRELGQGRNF